MIFTAHTLHAKVGLAGGIHSALIDSGSMINVICKDITQKLGLNMTPKPNLVMVAQSGHSTQCSACVEDAVISIGDILVPTPVFVAPGGDQEFILGRPFFMAALLGIQEQPDSTIKCVAFSTDHNWKIIFEAQQPTADNLKYAIDIWDNQVVPLN